MPELELIRSPDVERENRIPPGQRLVNQWPVLHYGQVQRIDPSGWKFSISGLVEKELWLDYREFMSLPRVRVLSDVHCVTGWSKLDNLWEGVSASQLKKLVRILPEARFVIVHAAGGFTTNLQISDFFETDVVFAVKHDGKPLTPEHGFPVRLVVPRLYFWKSAKWVTGVEFTAEDRPGFWESHGYHNRGDPWKEERYSE
ncbi:MAG: sulfite oxidase-like oxidoreductase [Hadesarchaea archaeon]|nr:sulfite oxidase-like oxidoreductase [Hadesarchaea archaeon]